MKENNSFLKNAQRPIDLICMGRVAVDLYAEQIGSELKDVQTFRKYLGGCAGNIAVGSARLGLRTSLLSMVGTDAFGQFLIEELKKEEVDTSALQQSKNHLTGLVVLGVCPPDHFPLIFYRNDCADMQLDASHFKEEWFKKARLLLITGTAFSKEQSKKATLAAIKLARLADTQVVLDLDYRPVLWGLTEIGDGESRFEKSKQVSLTLQEILPQVDLIVGTEDEIKIAGEDDCIPKALEKMRLFSSAPIVMKKGQRGCDIWLKGEKQPLHIEAYPVKVLNVLGAGDAFMSGLLSGLLSGRSFQEAAMTANAAGALVVSRHGCAPAMPSKEELVYFQETIFKDKDVLKHEKLDRLHRRTTLKASDRKAPMPILAFCHRWQLEHTCKEMQKPLSLIGDFKLALAQGLLKAVEDYSITHPWMICDPQYGLEAIGAVKDSAISVLVPMEKSNARLTEWLKKGSAYEILLERPKQWGVKLLWRYHPLWPKLEKEHQIQALQELFRACCKLDRKLMLELIIDEGMDRLETDLGASMKEVYEAGIRPYWWKIEAVKCREGLKNLAETIEYYDEDARIVLLGGEKKPLEDYRDTFRMAQYNKHVIGFAVGRSLFTDLWHDFVKGDISAGKVSEEISQSYFKLYQIWLEASR